MDKFIPNHLHLLVKGYFINPPHDEKTLNNFFIKLVNKVRMNVVAGPTSVYVNELGNEGITGTVTLATSHASMHVWDMEKPPMFQFDLYSCSEFTVEEVIECIDDNFGLLQYNYVFIDRNKNDFKIIDRN